MTEIDLPHLDLPARDAAVELLLEARRSNTTVDSLGAHTPTHELQSQAIDDRVAELVSIPVLGWKIGCTSEKAQEILGTDGPFSGRVYEVHASGVALEAAAHPSAHLEGEFAFTMAEALAAKPGGYRRDQVVAAVATVHPCIEVVGGRLTNFITAPVLAVMADCGANRSLVLGDAVANWHDLDLAATPGTMDVNGKVTGSGTGADVLGHPLDALTWLVNHLSDRGIGVDAGAVVSTGTCTSVVPVGAGDAATASFGPVGEVSVRFT